MPELPEVETVRLTLLPTLGAQVKSITTSGLPLRMGTVVPTRKLKALVGQTIVGLRRHGKYLLVDIGPSQSVLVHLGMSGRFRVHQASEPTVKHTHVVIELSGNRQLRFIDPRRFGQVDVLARANERSHPALKVLGPDPITEPHLTTGAYYYERAKRKQTSLKSFVLDQGVVAGVGNIYASEALWRIGLRPSATTKRLTRPLADKLATAIHDVLADALTKGGTTLRDFVNADGQAGENADYLQMYGRAGEPCPRCKTTIRRSVIQGRATYYCPTCQKP